MEKFVKLIFFATLSFGACKKQNKESENKSNSESEVTVIKTTNNTNNSSSTFTLPADANAEATRIFDDLANVDYEIGIIDNPNYGMFSSQPQYDIYLNGMTRVSDDISIVLNGNTYFGNPNDGQWMSQNIIFKNYIGANVNVVIKSGSNVLKQTSIYVPKAHLANKLGQPGNIYINRSGNSINWMVDNGNTSGKLILYYRLYDSNNMLLTTNGVILNETDGTFNLDNILSNLEIKKVFFIMVSGNTVSTIVNGKKLLFQISTRDQHEYLIN